MLVPSIFSNDPGTVNHEKILSFFHSQHRMKKSFDATYSETFIVEMYLESEIDLKCFMSFSFYIILLLWIEYRLLLHG